MGSRGFLIITAALMSVALGACVSYVKHLPEPKRDCAICHQLDEKGRPAEKGKALTRASSEALCSDCHIDRLKEGEHPTGVSPRKSTDLPLEEGMVTCVTCHEPHGIGGHHAMQRKEAPLLCLSCHDF